MEITVALLQKLAPRTKTDTLKQYVSPLNVIGKKYGISNTPQRLAGFLAQTMHESGEFTAVKENLNYSAAGLLKTFPKYFPTQVLAEQYARKPANIANRVYASRMGNGPESSGEGFKFCGRGLIQLTGKNNYTAMAKDFGMTVDECVKYLETVDGIVASAGWYWNTNKLNAYCDKNDIVGLSKAINGGTIGLEDRKQKYELALKTLTTK